MTSRYQHMKLFTTGFEVAVGKTHNGMFKVICSSQIHNINNLLTKFHVQKQRVAKIHPIFLVKAQIYSSRKPE